MSKIKKILFTSVFISASIFISFKSFAADMKDSSKFSISEQSKIHNLDNMLIVENQKKIEQIDDLIDKMTSERLKILSHSDNINTFYNDTYEQKLEKLGVKELNLSELNSFLSETGNIVPYSIVKPSDTNTVKWYLHNLVYSYSGKLYNFKSLIATGYNPGGMLVNALKNHTFFSGKEILLNYRKELISIYAQKAIGLIPLPIIQILPYELGFSNNENTIVNTNQVDTINISTIKFTYIKDSSYPDYMYSLVKYSNKANIWVKTYGSSVKNGKIFSYNKEKEYTLSSQHYNSNINFIKIYLQNRHVYDYIPFYTIYSNNKQYSKEIYLPNPLAGPGQIY